MAGTGYWRGAEKVCIWSRLPDALIYVLLSLDPWIKNYIFPASLAIGFLASGMLTGTIRVCNFRIPIPKEEEHYLLNDMPWVPPVLLTMLSWLLWWAALERG